MEVNVSHSAQAAMNGPSAYTTGADFCRIFADEMSSLYVLGYLLTADAEKAAQCFVAGIGDCVEGNAVFKEWARNWARRTIVRQAIQMSALNGNAPARAMQEEIEIDHHLKPVLKLDTLERFVYVMSVLEGYSYQDCSLLLGCSRQAVVDARNRAIKTLSQAAEGRVIRAEEGIQSTYALSN
jgi:predicted DNA-binding protein (UPF0251 family)